MITAFADVFEHSKITGETQILQAVKAVRVSADDFLVSVGQRGRPTSNFCQFVKKNREK